MKRRKAIGSILIAGGATAIGFGGYKWYSLTKIPDKNYLYSRKPLLADLAETIIPATDTPGAREAGVVEYMMNLLNECTDPKTLNRFIKGLQDLEIYTRSRHLREFSECSIPEKESILNFFDQQSGTGKSLIE